jgi:twinkle protein
MQGQPEAVISAIWNAKVYRPDGLVSVDDLMPDLDKPIVQGLPWFLESLTKLTYGRRMGEVYGFGAGTGIGKTDLFTQQIEYDINTLGQQVGLIFLEQKPLETIVRVAGKAKGKRFHVPDGSWSVEERKAAVQELAGKVTLYDSFGQTDWDVVANKIRFMAKSEGIKIFYLDHLTAMADTADERGSLEQIMKEMAGLANELQVIIHFVSHLTTPEGKPHEEGGHVSIRHFKGSRAIGFWSYFMFGLERNQQAEDPAEQSTTILRVLKDRYTGQATGHLIYLGYNHESGLLFETTKPEKHGFTDETKPEF